MHDCRDPHVEPHHPDLAVTFTMESSEVPPEYSGVNGVNGEKPDCSSRASKADHIQTKKQIATNGLTVDSETQS